MPRYDHFEKRLDSHNKDHVAYPKALEVSVRRGRQVFPDTGKQVYGNKLLVFTGIALVDQGGDRGDEDRVVRGTVRIKLDRPLLGNEQFIGAATTASLASVFTNDELLTFAVDEAETVVAEDNDLWLILRIAVQGESALVNRISYQANVIILAADVELASIEVAPETLAADSTPTPGIFGPSARFQRGGNWYLKVRLSGPTPRATIVDLASGKPSIAPVPPEVAFQPLQSEAIVGPLPTVGPTTQNAKVTIAGFLNGIEKTAVLDLFREPS